MLLARIAQNLKDQNWVAVAIEFVIVISGITIGFQITSWNETRQDYAREEVILDRLRSDFQVIVALTESNAAILASKAETSEAFADQLLANEVVPGSEAFHTALSGSIGTSVPSGRSATYVELLASGDMRLIRSEELRNAMVKFDEQVRRQELAYNSLTIMVIDNARILLEVRALGTNLDGLPESAYSLAIESQVASPEFLVALRLMRLVSARNLLWHEGTLEYAEEVLAALG